MATHRIRIFNETLTPDATGGAWLEPFQIPGSGGAFNHLILNLSDPGASDVFGVSGVFHVPQNYSTNADIVIDWCANDITGDDVLFAFDYRAITGDGTEDYDQATYQEQVDIQDQTPTTAGYHFHRNIVTGSLTNGNFAAGDTVEFYFYRDGVTGIPTDDLAADVYVFGVYFEYDDA